MLHLLKTKQIRTGISRHVAWLMLVFVLSSPLLVSALENIPLPPPSVYTTAQKNLPGNTDPRTANLAGATEVITNILASETVNQNNSAGTDLDAIIQAGKLRVLYTTGNQDSLAIANVEKIMLERFAQEHDLVLEWIESESQWSLLPDLTAGKGDIIIGQGQSIAAGIQNQVSFTSPWVASRQQIIVRTDTTQIKSLADLASRQVAIKKSSPVWPAIEELAANSLAMDVVVVPEAFPQEMIMARVASGQYDITIADSDFVDSYLPQHPQLSVAYDINAGEPRAWAVNTDARNLQIALNQFLNKNHLEFNIAQVHLGDLPQMLERKILRLITYKNPVNYYFSGGRFHGFEYELIRKFARAKKMRVDVVLANSHEEMQQLLLNGEGDIVAAALPDNSIINDKIEFSTSYDSSAPLIIGRQSDEPIYDIRDLEGRRITLSAESPYLNLLERIRKRGIDFDIITAEPGLDTEATITMVARGMFDLTILNSHQFNNELAEQYSIKAHFALSDPVPHGWAVRTADIQLLTELNKYARTEYRSNFYNMLYAKYIEHPQRKIASSRFLPDVDQLSPYDALVRKYAEEYSFDWRLIIAQMYQESRFDPQAISFKGAEGLMQMMPTTAEDIGAQNLDDPASSIKAGVKYLSMLRGQFENDLLLEDRTWFTLASYNAGFGRVKQARERAAQMGLDPDRWFGNVEKAMMVMATPFEKDGEMIRNCRCGETVVYVHEIRTLYNNYVRLTQPLQVARTEQRRILPFDI